MSGIVEMHEHGLRVQCADGTVVSCRGLLLHEAKFILDQWKRMQSEEPLERAEARVAIVERFSAIYPELAAHIGAGDVEALIPSFFWWSTGATIAGQPSPTGTPSPPPTSPPGA